MDLIWQKFTEWLKELLISGIMDNVNGLFDNVNSRVAGIAGQVGATPQGWNSGVYGMIRTLSDNVILPIAGVILAFVMTLELIQLITEKNNMHDVDTWMFFKWIFKTACAVLIVTNTWNIVMGVFEAAQSVVNSASGIIISDTSLTFNEHIAGFEAARCAPSVPAALPFTAMLFFLPTPSTPPWRNRRLRRCGRFGDRLSVPTLTYC